MTTQDVNVVVMDFKTSKGKEMVSINEDGTYTILINSRLSYDGQLRAYNHAMKHIQENDFEKEDVQKIEYDAHATAADIIPMPAQEYLDRIKALKAERRRLQRQIKRDQERVRFITEHCDMYARGEHQYLYGNDL